MNPFRLLINTCLILSLLNYEGIKAQSRANDSSLSRVEKDRLVEIANELFIKRPSIAFNISNYDITSSFESIPNPVEYGQNYLDSLLGVLEEEESNSLTMLKIAGYYDGNDQSLLAQSYYKKAFENLDVSVFKDSAAYFSNRAVLKNRLGKKDALEDLKKSLEINPNDSLAIQIYPMLLMQDNDYEEARKVLWYALEKGFGSKRVAYIKLIGLETMQAGKRILTLERKGINVKKKYSNKNYDEIVDFSLISKYEKMHPYALEIIWTRRIGDIAGIFSKMLFLSEFENNKIAFPFTSYDQLKIESLIKEFSEASGPEAINEYTRNRYLGYLYFLNSEWDESLSHFQSALDIFPKEKRDIVFNEADCQYMMMSIYIMDSDTENYRKLIQKKIQNEPDRSNSTDDLMLLAYDYFQNGELKQAEDLCNEVMLIDSNHFSTLLLKSHLSFLAGETQLAQFYLENAGKNLNEPSQEYNLTLQYAIYLIYEGNTEMARSVLETLQASRGSKKCPDCDTLIKEFCR